MTDSSADAQVELQKAVKNLTLGQGQTLDLDLECHLNWIRIEDVSKEIVETSLEERDERWMEIHGNSASTEIKLSHHLSQVVFAHWINDNESAMANLKVMEELLESEELKELLPERVQAYLYIIHANRAVLAFRMNDIDASDEAKRKATEFDISKPKARALILSMKAGTVGFAGNRERSVELWRHVYELDTDVVHYLSSYSRAIRRLRRLRDNFLEPPSEFEIELAEKAFEIDPDDSKALYTMTRLYFDILRQTHVDSSYVKTCSVLRKTGIEELVRKLKLLARKGAKENPGCPNYAINLAKILNYGPKGLEWGDDEEGEAGRREAREQYLHCLKTWRNNSHVLHQVGKYMTRGPAEDREIGTELVKLSMMAIEARNFPAVMEYIRLVSATKSTDPAGLDELIDLLDDQIPRFEKLSSHCARLQCLKATLLFKKYEFGAAVEVWLKAFNMDPWLFNRDATAFNGKRTLKVIFTEADYRKLRAYVTSLLENTPDDEDGRIENAPIEEPGRKAGLQEILVAITPKYSPIMLRRKNRPTVSEEEDSSGRSNSESWRTTLAPINRNSPRSNEPMSSSSARGRGKPSSSFFGVNAKNDTNWRAKPK